MNYVEGDIFGYDNFDYVTMASLNYEGNTYICGMVVVDGENTTDIAAFFKVTNDGLEIVVDGFMQNLLNLKFQKVLGDKINQILSEVNDSD